MNTKQEFLDWLAEQDSYYIPDSEVAEKFPDLDVEMVGVTKAYDSDTGETLTPVRDWRQAVKYGRVVD